MDSGTQRVCAGCYQIGQSLSVCTRCKAYCYCNKTCQAAHWKLVHKRTCKPQEILPPMEDDCLTTFLLDLDSNIHNSLDIRYDHIILYPCNSISELKQNIEAVIVGCHDDDLEKYISEELPAKDSNSNGSDCSSSNDPTNGLSNSIINKYKWKNGISSTTLPGYSMDYNGTTKMVAYHDANTVNDISLGYSICGTYILMSGHCNGNIIITKRNTHEELAKLSRREILSICSYNYKCSELNTVSTRIHFENIRRNEAKIVLHKQGYNII